MSGIETRVAVLIVNYNAGDALTRFHPRQGGEVQTLADRVAQGPGEKETPEQEQEETSHA